MDGVPHHRITEGAVLPVGCRALERARERAGDGQIRRDLEQALVITRLNLLVQVGAVAKGALLGEQDIEGIGGGRSG